MFENITENFLGETKKEVYTQLTNWILNNELEG